MLETGFIVLQLVQFQIHFFREKEQNNFEYIIRYRASEGAPTVRVPEMSARFPQHQSHHLAHTKLKAIFSQCSSSTALTGKLVSQTLSNRLFHLAMLYHCLTTSIDVGVVCKLRFQKTWKGPSDSFLTTHLTTSTARMRAQKRK